LNAAVDELDARIKQQKVDVDRYKRLVEIKTQPLKRIEEVQLALNVLESQRTSAKARLDEATNGPTKTERALAEARVREAEKALAVAQLDRKDSAVKAPFDGVITGRFRSVGDYANSGPMTEVMELTDATRLEADLRLPESCLGRVKPGKTEVIIRGALVKEDLRLPVTRVVPSVDQGMFAVRVAVPPERRGALAPGAFITGTVKMEGGGEGAIVPQGAVRIDGEGPFVFVAADGKMERRAVTTGDRLSEGVIIRSGLKAGEKVLVGGPSASLKHGAELPEDLKGK
jgi:HlyD family secretion protein